MKRLFAAVATSLLLFACNDDHAHLHVMTSKEPVVHAEHPGAIAVAHGVAIAVQPSMIHPEIEGSTALPVTGMRSEDPSTLEVKPASRAYDVDESVSPNGLSWVLLGTKPGSTTLHLYRDDDEVGAVTVDVVEQVP